MTSGDEFIARVKRRGPSDKVCGPFLSMFLALCGPTAFGRESKAPALGTAPKQAVDKEQERMDGLEFIARDSEL
jgi:hypothetical protein